MKLLFLAPIVPLKEIHLNRPYFELPKAMYFVNSEGVLLAGKINVPPPKGLRTYETGVGSNRQFDIFKAYTKTIQVILKEKPQIVVFFHMNLLLSFFIIHNRVKRVFSKKRSGCKPTWVLKLDWDGTKFEGISTLGMKLRNLFLSYNSLFLDYIIAENSCSFNATLGLPFVKKDKVRLIPNAASVDYIECNYDPRLRDKTILTVARISPEKGIDILIKSFLRISQDFPEWSLEIIGPIDDENYYKLLDKLIEKNSMSKTIKILGPMYGKQLRGYYEKASIFCLASYIESFSLVRVEAIRSGIPLITTTAGCGIDFTRLGSTIVPPGDTIALSNGLTTLMESEPLRL